METRSRKKIRRASETEIESNDRLSSLTDDVIHIILSFLLIQSVAKMATLSRRWKVIWRSYPHLDFSELGHKAKPMDFLPSLLSLHTPKSITSLTLCNKLFNLSCMRSTLGLLASHDIRELILDVIPLRKFTWPRCLFEFTTIKVLKLRASCGPNLNLQTLYAQGSACFRSLHVLSLAKVKFIGSSISSLFSADIFPSLKTLNLRCCEGMQNLKINCPSLENIHISWVLSLESLDIECAKLEELLVECCLSFNSFTVIAPKMHRFFWIGNQVPDNFTVVGSKTVNTAKIYSNGWDLMQCAESLKTVAMLWNVICSVRNLIVNYLVIQYLADTGFASALPKCFNNLSSLELHTGSRLYDIPGTLCILRSAPFLSTLNIHVDNKIECSRDRYHLSLEQLLESHGGAIESFETHLRVVNITIEGIKVYDTTVEMMKFILRHAQVLQKMTITVLRMNPPLSQQAISLEIMKFERASSDVTISFTQSL